MALLRGSHDLLAVTGADGALTWVNDRFAQTSGMQAGPASHLIDLLPPESQADRRAVDEALRTGHLAPREMRLRTLQGEDLWVCAQADSSADQRVWALKDIGNEVALRERAERQTELFDMAQEFGRIGIWERSIPSGEGHWDKHVFGFWGLPVQDGTPNFAEAVARLHPEDRGQLGYLESTRRAGRYSQRYRVVRPDGSIRWIHSQWEVKNSKAGVPERAIGIMMDDTEVYEQVRTLGAASAQLQLAVELGNIAIWRQDLKTDLVHFNDRGFSVLGLTPHRQALRADEVSALIHPDDLQAVTAAARQAMQSDQPLDVVARYRRADGQWRHVLSRRVVQRNPDGTAQALVGVALDVTEQVQREREAESLAQRLEIAAAAAGVGIWSLDTATEEVQWNEQMFLITGRSRDSGPLAGDAFIEHVVHRDDRALVRSARLRLRSEPTGLIEDQYRIVRPNGELRWLVSRIRLEVRDGRPMAFGVTLDATDRRRAEIALRQADERAALAARSAGIGTWEIDLQTGVERWDEQMFLLRGMAPADTPPSRTERLAMVHEDDRARLLDTRGEVMYGQEASSYEFRITRADGEQRWLASRSLALRDDEGRLLRRAGINWDITESKNAEVARREKELAERASQAKSQFLARMSHELRTPLNAVLGFTQLLQIEVGSQGAAAQIDKLAHIRAAGEHLLTLIDDVLELSRLESGELRLQSTVLELSTVVDQALPLVEPLAREFRVSLRPVRGQGVVRTDRTRMLQVVVNLLTNAIKYNRPGGEVFVDIEPHEGSVRLRVRDTGRGMTPQQREHLFEPFNRLGLEDEGIAGTGIGLAIVKSLLQALAGRIDVTSEPGQGSCFEVTLPGSSEPIAEQAPGHAAPLATGPRAAPATLVLYVEDNPVNVVLVEEVVRHLCGLRFASAATGAEGLLRARELKPDLILLDMQLPDMDGIEVLRRLRADDATRAVRCIALSANAMPEDIERTLASGAENYWTKPIDVRALTSALGAMFGPATG